MAARDAGPAALAYRLADLRVAFGLASPAQRRTILAELVAEAGRVAPELVESIEGSARAAVALYAGRRAGRGGDE